MTPITNVYEIGENDPLRKARGVTERWTPIQALAIDVAWTVRVAAVPADDFNWSGGTFIYIPGVRPDCQQRGVDDSRQQWLLELGPDQWGKRHRCSGDALTARATDRGERQAQLEEDD